MNLTKVYLMKKFEKYYLESDLEMPREFKKREFAFVPFETLPDFVMHRHISFTSKDEFKAYILSKIPAHIYYSSAYYERPDVDKMEKKGWLGADLIFDIDADHLPIKTRSFEKALNIAKREAKKLILILRKDFGVEDYEVFFSGGRGYHVHVHDEEFLTLNSAERREIVDYILLNSPKLDMKSNAYRRVLAYVKKKLARNKELREKFEISIEELRGEMMTKRLKKAFNYLKDEALAKLRVYIDAPVTADVKRLIRLPGSLHGKTGLKVTRVEDIDKFDPLRDAVVFGDNEVPLKILKRVKIRIGDCKLSLSPGEVAKVPEYAAVFLLCRGFAIYG